MNKHAILQGQVSHQRFDPIEHGFDYAFNLPCIQLDQIESFVSTSNILRLNRPGVFAFHRSDYHGSPDNSLDASVRDTIEKKCGQRPQGPICLVDMLRHFGYSFNPVCFYLCYSATGDTVEYILAEITNTPWRQKFSYVLTPLDNIGNNKHHIYEFEKNFHISPFNSMNQSYRWEFTFDRNEIGIHMKNFENGRCLFKADYTAEFLPATEQHINNLFIKFPIASIRAISLIYFNAFKLWIKKSPFFEHPQHKAPAHDH